MGVMITLTLSLEVDGKAKHVQVDSLRHGDFVTGAQHIREQFLEPMSEIILHAYKELRQESERDLNDPVMSSLEERASISRRLAAIGMV